MTMQRYIIGIKYSGHQLPEQAQIISVLFLLCGYLDFNH